MAKSSDQPLKPNPFSTYRDPQTGLWIVTKDTSNIQSDLVKPFVSEKGKDEACEEIESNLFS